MSRKIIDRWQSFDFLLMYIKKYFSKMRLKKRWNHKSGFHVENYWIIECALPPPSPPQARFPLSAPPSISHLVAFSSGGHGAPVLWHKPTYLETWKKFYMFQAQQSCHKPQSQWNVAWQLLFASSGCEVSDWFRDRAARLEATLFFMS